MSAYTPAPWRQTGVNVRAGGALVAIAVDHWHDVKTSEKEKLANARLIAAAPELADALMRAAVALDAYSGGECEELDGIMALLARVEGVTP